MAFCCDREDAISLGLGALSRLLEGYRIDLCNIGRCVSAPAGVHTYLASPNKQLRRLEVGTESAADHSKSVKSYLMQLFDAAGNHNVLASLDLNCGCPTSSTPPDSTSAGQGTDCKHACYGATAALMNAVAWIESSAWDCRLAVVVATDVAVYAPGPARATGGAGAVALLIGMLLCCHLCRPLAGPHQGSTLTICHTMQALMHPWCRIYGVHTVTIVMHLTSGSPMVCIPRCAAGARASFEKGLSPQVFCRLCRWTALCRCPCIWRHCFAATKASMQSLRQVCR